MCNFWGLFLLPLKAKANSPLACTGTEPLLCYRAELEEQSEAVPWEESSAQLSYCSSPAIPQATFQGFIKYRETRRGSRATFLGRETK